MCRVTQTGFQLERAKKWDGCQGTGPTADYVILAGKGPVGKNTELFRKGGNGVSVIQPGNINRSQKLLTQK